MYLTFRALIAPSEQSDIADRYHLFDIVIPFHVNATLTTSITAFSYGGYQEVCQ